MAEYLLYSQTVSASLEDFILRVALKLGSSLILDTASCFYFFSLSLVSLFSVCCELHASIMEHSFPSNQGTLIWGEISRYLRVLPNNLQMGGSLVTVTVIGNS